jgi:hypothetical protein
MKALKAVCPFLISWGFVCMSSSLDFTFLRSSAWALAVVFAVTLLANVMAQVGLHTVCSGRVLL